MRKRIYGPCGAILHLDEGGMYVRNSWTFAAVEFRGRWSSYDNAIALERVHDEDLPLAVLEWLTAQAPEVELAYAGD